MIFVIFFPPSLGVVVVVVVVGEKFYHNKFPHNQCACVFYVCAVCWVAPKTTTRARSSLSLRWHENSKKNPSSLIILQLLSSLFELKLITRRFDIGKKQSTLDLPKNHNLKRLLLLRGPILSSEFAL